MAKSTYNHQSIGCAEAEKGTDRMCPGGDEECIGARLSEVRYINILNLNSNSKCVIH